MPVVVMEEGRWRRESRYEVALRGEEPACNGLCHPVKRGDAEGWWCLSSSPILGEVALDKRLVPYDAKEWSMKGKL